MLTEFTDEIEQLAVSSTSAFSRGGMATKLQAAKYCMKNGVDVAIINGNDPGNILSVITGQDVGTFIRFIGNIHGDIKIPVLDRDNLSDEFQELILR